MEKKVRIDFWKGMVILLSIWFLFSSAVIFSYSHAQQDYVESYNDLADKYNACIRPVKVNSWNVSQLNKILETKGG